MSEQINLNNKKIENFGEKEIEEFVQGVFEKLDEILPSPVKDGSGEEIISEEIHRDTGGNSIQVIGEEKTKNQIIFTVRTPDGRLFKRTWRIGGNTKKGEFVDEEIKDPTPPAQ